MRRTIILFAFLFVAGTSYGQVDCLTRTESNHTLIINREGGNLAFGNILRAYDPDGRCVGTVTLADGNTAIALWGEDSINPTGGLLPGETFRIVLVRGGTEVPVTYNVVSGPAVYQPNGITVANNYIAAEPEEPAEVAALDVSFTETSGTVRGSFTRSIAVSGDYGALMIEVTGTGVDLQNIIVTREDFDLADIYATDTLLAAGLIGPSIAGHFIDVEALPVMNSGQLAISQVQAVDSSNNIIEVVVTNGTSSFTLLILGDIDESGQVNMADVTRLFLDLIGVNPLTADERDNADVSPYPGGNDVINIQDFFVLGRATILNQWPDGSPVN